MNDDFRFQTPDQEEISNIDSSGSMTTDHLIELVEQTRNNLLRTQRRMERSERQYEALMRHIQALWLFVGLVVIGGAGLSWFEFSVLSRQVRVLPVQNAAQDLKSENGGNIANLGSPAKPESAVPPVPSQLQAGTPIQPLIPAEPVPAAHELSNPSVQNPSRQPPGNRKKVTDVSAVKELSDGIQRHRVDFAVTSNRTEQISPGLYLTINGTDVPLQEVDGWLQIASDGHTVWIHSQEAQKVLIFGGKRDPRRVALVFTRIEPNKVSGYLMVPAAESGD